MLPAHRTRRPVSWHWRTAGAATVALIAASTTSAASTKPLEATSAHWAVGGKLITFTGWYGRDRSNARLWVMNPDGTHRRPISTGGTGVIATLGTASLSPDGSTVAETYDTGKAGLLILRRPGGKVTRQFALRVRSGECFGPTAWAPDGRAIAVEISTTNRSLIFVADLRVRSRALDQPQWVPGRIRSGVVARRPPYCFHQLLGWLSSRRHGSGRTSTETPHA